MLDWQSECPNSVPDFNIDFGVNKILEPFYSNFKIIPPYINLLQSDQITLNQFSPKREMNVI